MQKAKVSSAKQKSRNHFIHSIWNRRASLITALTVAGIVAFLILRFGLSASESNANIPLLISMIIGGLPLFFDMGKKLLKREFGADLLGGISIITAVLLNEYLAGAIIVLMLSGGQALENYALRSASSVLGALAKRMPSVAHKKVGKDLLDIDLQELVPGDILVIYPHEICPVDGILIDGHGSMDESYLTGEPFQIAKTSGSTLISGAINGESALTMKCTRQAADSRYAKIMEVMRESEASRPQMRRLGDRLGALYTPLALILAFTAWAISGDATRFLAVLVVATPCPLLIGIPITIIGSISLCARKSIIVKNAAVLEQIAECRTAIFDKTGTLTYGEPKLIDQVHPSGVDSQQVLQYAASLERYSKHPLARAILAEAQSQKLKLLQANELVEAPGHGLKGTVAGQQVQITSRTKIDRAELERVQKHVDFSGGLECIVLVDGKFAAAYHFRDAPRAESKSFVRHLLPKHGFKRVLLVSGDREAEVHYLAEQVGISEIHSQQSPEQKLALVRTETKLAKTLYVGDGINDAPAMMAATVGMSIGSNSDVTSEAAGVVILKNSLKKVDEFMHISSRMRSIALQSAFGGMALSLVAMAFAFMGHLSPVQGAIIQEVIDVLSVLNALRAAFPPRILHDMHK